MNFYWTLQIKFSTFDLKKPILEAEICLWPIFSVILVNTVLICKVTKKVTLLTQKNEDFQSYNQRLFLLFKKNILVK